MPVNTLVGQVSAVALNFDGVLIDKHGTEVRGAADTVRQLAGAPHFGPEKLALVTTTMFADGVEDYLDRTGLGEFFGVRVTGDDTNGMPEPAMVVCEETVRQLRCEADEVALVAAQRDMILSGRRVGMGVLRYIPLHHTVESFKTDVSRAVVHMSAIPPMLRVA